VYLHYNDNDNHYQIGEVMKRILLSLSLVFLLVGCVPKNEPNDKITIVVSFYPLEYFTKRIAGDLVNVIDLLPIAGEPHDWEPSTQDMITLTEADHVFILGNNFESWFDDAYASIDHEGQGLLIVSEGIPTIISEIKQQIDPHVWTSLKHDITLLTTIKNYLVKIDPDHASVYEANYSLVKADFEALDMEYTTALATRVRDEFVTNHAAFGYLALDYGLKMIPIMGIEPDAEPDAATMASIIDIVNQYQIPYILYEDEADTAVADAIAAETGALTGILRPGESLNEAQIAAGEDFLSIMKQNLEWLKKALN
jgi:zinc transport system substrate-binding protein